VSASLQDILAQHVARLHTEIMTRTIFRDFADLYPHRFTNVTNGSAVRRWFTQSNPALSALLTEHLRCCEAR
jgi:starch phosphorylase